MEQKKNPVWKTIYLVVLTVVTIVCIIFGIMRWSTGFFGLFGSDKGYERLNTMAVVDIEAFDSMNLDLDVGDLEIKAGDGYQIQYDYPQKLQPEIEVKNGKLTVVQKQKKIHHSIQSYTIIITVPRDLKMKSIDAYMDMGGIELADVYAENLTLDADMGSVDISGSEFGKIDIDADMGSIKLTKISFKKASCSADMGGIDIEGDFENIEADCSMGSVNVETSRDPDGIVMDLSADMGDVTVNGKDQGSKYVQ